MLTLHRQGRDRQAGLTLIEILISMIVLSIVSTMLIAGWINLQRASAFAVNTNNARATARDAMSRAVAELRGAQPTSLPTSTPSPSVTPTPQPPITTASPMAVTFNSSFNSVNANADGSGISSTALRPTRLWLDPTLQSAPWNTNARTLWLQRDMNGNGFSLTDSGDKNILLARNVVNALVPDTTNTPPTGGTTYTPLFRYGYRTTTGGPVLWMDNADNSLVLANVVAIRVRIIIDTNRAHTPNYVDNTITVRLRNASRD
jgi:prepilin-type N-terminal cleavage/methylation domain-containing protein